MVPFAKTAKVAANHESSTANLGRKEGRGKKEGISTIKLHKITYYGRAFYGRTFAHPLEPRSILLLLSLSLSLCDSRRLQRVTIACEGNCGKSLSLQLRTVLFRHHVETYRSLLLAFRRKPETVIRPDVAGITRPFGARRMRAIENCR